jgi:uncharacterized iron-regulated membrane protein
MITEEGSSMPSNTLFSQESNGQRAWPGWQRLHRWHFYAGLFCLPFIILLSITGAIYLFKPQIEAQLYRSFNQLVVNQPQPPSAQVKAALAGIPDGVLNAYVLPETPRAASQVLVGKDSQLFRVWVHPESLAILGQQPEDGRLMRWIFRLHGELLLGDQGSMLVELAASWSIVLILTGLLLWWPRQASGIGGVLYPRIGKGRSVFWRDLHAVTGIWIAFFVLFLLISGLPWAKSWGGMLKSIRHFGATMAVQQDWTTGRGDELNERRRMNSPALNSPRPLNDHADQHGHSVMGNTLQDYRALDMLVPAIQPLNLPSPVLITPPSKRSAAWQARSDTQNRPQRITLTLDAATGQVLKQQTFADKPLLDRVIGYGIAAHEGQLFGLPNQLLGLFTAVGLLLVTFSSIVLWWRRNQSRKSPDATKLRKTLGAPPYIASRQPLARGLFVIIGALAILLPLFGLSLLALMLTEKLVLSHIPPARHFLGLPPLV